MNRLEIFQLETLHTLCFLHHFRMLLELCVMHQPGLTDVSQITHCSLLQKLWLTGCGLVDASALEPLEHLREVYLCRNSLPQAPDLSRSKKLHTLWICDNRLQSLRSLKALPCLERLWVCGNEIDRMDYALEGFSKLAQVNLSGNLIDGFADLSHMARLPALRELWLQDAHFGRNPVCQLHNYSTYLVCSFPQLDALDGRQVSPELRQVTQATFRKKRMYYNMRIKSIKCQAHEALSRAREVYSKHAARSAIRQNVLLRKLRAVAREIEEEQEYAGGKADRIKPKDRIDLEKWKEVEAKLQQLLCLKQLEMERFTAALDQMKSRVILRRDEQEQALRMELHTGGNARLLEGSPADAWFKACTDLLQSRFHADMYKPHGIRGIRIRGVRRVVNRVLRSKFDRQVEQERKNRKEKGQALREPKFEYLIFIAQTHLAHLKIAHEGFNIHDTDTCVCLSTGLYATELADKSTANPKAQCCVLTKVFSLDQSTKNERAGENENGDEDAEDARDKASKGWKSCDTALLLPEYIVDLEYVEAAEKLCVAEDAQLNPAGPSTGFGDLLDAYVRQMKACVGLPISLPFSDGDLPSARTSLKELSPSSLRSWISPHPDLNLAQLVYLNLHDAGLRSLEGISCCPQLQRLIVCFNELSDLRGLHAITHLRFLDAGHNVIKSIEGIEDLVFLRQIKLNNNLLYRLDGLDKLDLRVPSLTSMDLQCNPICEIKNFRQMIIEKMTNLISLDNKPISKQEREELAKAPSLTGIQAFLVHGKDHYGSRVDEGRLAEIEEISMEHGRIRELADLQLVPRLRRLNVDDNEVTSLAGVERCACLEELSAAENKICKIDHLAGLASLQKLDLGFNKISRIEGLSSLQNLSQLCLEGNDIHSLTGVEDLQNLAELYIAGNQVSDLKQVRILRKLKNLTILDLSDNPLCASPTARLYTVFCLRGLKILNGAGISRDEQENAKNTYHGKLTQEILEEKLSPSTAFEDVQALELQHCRIASIADGFLHAGRFPRLTSINLSGNRLGKVEGFSLLPSVERLQLGDNVIEEVSREEMAHFPNLVELRLDGNRISDLNKVRVEGLAKLEKLDLQGNEIAQLSGLEGCGQVKELNLDRNRIRSLEGIAYMLPPMEHLQTLRLEGNYIRTLGVFHLQPGIHSLFLAHNRINDFLEIDKLHSLKHLLQLSLHSNPLTRKPHYRPRAVRNLAALRFLDAVEVTANDRRAAGQFGDFPSDLPSNAEQEQTDMLLGFVGEQEDKERLDDVSLALGVQGSRLSGRGAKGQYLGPAMVGFARMAPRAASISNNAAGVSSSLSMTRIEGVKVNTKQRLELPQLGQRGGNRGSRSRAAAGRKAVLPMRPIHHQRQLLFSPK